jgi:hypothetical protein
MVVASRPVTLRRRGFKYESAGEDKVGEKAVDALKCTGPDGKTFTLLLDKESGLPLAIRARLRGRGDVEMDREVTFADYKDFDGIKKATKMDFAIGDKGSATFTIVEFKVLDKVDPDTFAEPK